MKFASFILLLAAANSQAWYTHWGSSFTKPSSPTVSSALSDWLEKTLSPPFPSSEAVEDFCLAGTPLEGALRRASEECNSPVRVSLLANVDDETRQCALQAVGIVNGDGDIIREAGQALVSSDLASEEAECYGLSQDEDQVISLMKVDQSKEEDNDWYSYFNRRSRHRGSGKRRRRQRQSTKSLETLAAEAAPTVYAACLIQSLQKDCGERASELLETEAGWAKSGVIPVRLQGTPPTLGLTTDGGRVVSPGDEVCTDELEVIPQLEWDCDPDKLYTVMMLDNDGIPAPFEYLNWFRYNIPGCDVASGTSSFCASSA